MTNSLSSGRYLSDSWADKTLNKTLVRVPTCYNSRTDVMLQTQYCADISSKAITPEALLAGGR